jgi:hypothetical protein
MAEMTSPSTFEPIDDGRNLQVTRRTRMTISVSQ